MDILATTSIVAAFIAGVAALFAPCCITVLLPSYLGSVFKERYKVFLMTFVFFLGILTVFLPIGLGASALAKVFSEYHNIIFAIGGVFLVVLGILMLVGKNMTLPWSVHPTAKKYSIGSVYVLGVFSAIATTCCAPVLAGVIALSAASGSLWLGSIYTFSYVLGMVMPLFIIAGALDKMNYTKRFAVLRRPRQITFAGVMWKFVWAEAISGLVFLIMGGYITYLALTRDLYSHAGYQLSVNLFLARINASLNGVINFVPQYVWAVLIVAVVAALTALFIKEIKYVKKDDK